MTTETITIESMTRLASALNTASAEVAYFARIAQAGEITPEQAAKEVARVMKRINKAAKP